MKISELHVDVIYSPEFYVKIKNRSILVGQLVAETNVTRQTKSSTADTLMVITKVCYHGNSLFSISSQYSSYF